MQLICIKEISLEVKLYLQCLHLHFFIRFSSFTSLWQDLQKNHALNHKNVIRRIMENLQRYLKFNFEIEKWSKTTEKLTCFPISPFGGFKLDESNILVENLKFTFLPPLQIVLWRIRLNLRESSPCLDWCRSWDLSWPRPRHSSPLWRAAAASV